jgi:hypothetical protein
VPIADLPLEMPVVERVKIDSRKRMSEFALGGNK